MQLQDLNAFVAVATERSFSKAAKTLHRTQPAISQAIRRLEDELGDKLFDRTSRNGALTEAGVLLQEHAARLLRFAVGGRSGGPRAAAGPPRPRRHRRQRGRRPLAAADHRAVRARAPAGARRSAPRARRAQIATELLERSLDFGVLTFQPPDKGLQSISLGSDELVMLAHPDASARGAEARLDRGSRAARPSSRTTIRRRRASACCALYERRHAPINIQIALPSLDGIKRAVEMGLGVAVLPRRCALTEIARGQLVAVKVPGAELAAARSGWSSGEAASSSHAAEAFLEIARADGA